MNDLHTMTYEKAYERLEVILENMNSGKLSLEQSLAFFEEADQLITYCNQKLVSAEEKIETLMKNREGHLALSPSSEPIKEPFTLALGGVLSRDVGV